MAQGEEWAVSHKDGAASNRRSSEDRTAPHRLSLEERRHLTVTGVSEVVSFEEDGAVLRTSKGMLLVRGQGLELKLLSPDGGQVALDGTIIGILYEEPRREGGFFSRLFG